MKRLWNLHWEKISAILAVIAIVGGWIGNVLSGGWVVSALLTILVWINGVLLFEVAIYWVLILLVVVLFLYFSIRNIRKLSVKAPPFRSYVTDEINGHKYVWSYNADYNGMPDFFKMICKDCNMDMPTMSESGYVGFSYRCPNCKKEITSNDSSVDLSNIVQYRIKEKYGKK